MKNNKGGSSLILLLIAVVGVGIMGGRDTIPARFTLPPIWKKPDGIGELIDQFLE